MVRVQLHKSALLAVLALIVLASFSTVAFAGDKVKVEGIIKGRSGPQVILQTSDQPKLVVVADRSNPSAAGAGCLQGSQEGNVHGGTDSRPRD